MKGHSVHLLGEAYHHQRIMHVLLKIRPATSPAFLETQPPEAAPTRTQPDLEPIIMMPGCSWAYARVTRQTHPSCSEQFGIKLSKNPFAKQKKPG
jgi:hypothetical protein